MSTSQLDTASLPPWIGIAISLVIAAATYGGLRHQVEANTSDIHELRTDVRDDLKEIRSDVKKLIQRGQ